MPKKTRLLKRYKTLPLSHLMGFYPDKADTSKKAIMVEEVCHGETEKAQGLLVCPIRGSYLAPESCSGQGIRPSRDSVLPRADGTACTSGMELCPINCSFVPLTAYTCAPVGPKDSFALAPTPFGNFSETTKKSSSVIEMPPIGSMNLLQRWLIQGSACQAELAAFNRRSPRTCVTLDRSADNAAAAVAAGGLAAYSAGSIVLLNGVVGFSLNSRSPGQAQSNVESNGSLFLDSRSEFSPTSGGSVDSESPSAALQCVE